MAVDGWSGFGRMTSRHLSASAGSMVFRRNSLGSVVAKLRTAWKLAVADVEYGSAIAGSHDKPRSSLQMRRGVASGVPTSSSYLQQVSAARFALTRMLSGIPPLKDPEEMLILVRSFDEIKR